MTRFAILVIYCLITFTITTINSVEARNKRQRFIPGPVYAELIRVVDGDTVLVDAEPWPNYYITVYVRLRDIDTPELNSKCLNVRKRAKAAKLALSEMLIGQKLQLYNITGGKYYGRILADMKLQDGDNVSQLLLKSGHAIAYKSRSKSKNCNAQS